MNDQASTTGVGGAVDTAKLVGAIVPLKADAFPFYVLLAGIAMAGLALFVLLRERKPGAGDAERA